MDLLRLDQQLCFALYAASRAMTRAYGPLLEPLGLTYPQYLVMLVLWESSPVTVKYLGQRLQLDSGTLTPLLKRLEAEGYLTRKRSHDDERVVELDLTPTGRDLKSRAQEIPPTVASCIGIQTQDDWARFYKMREDLHDLVRTLNTIPEP